MPVSGYGEPGFKPFGRHSSDSVAGVPIKKRRFPFIVPQSPPSPTESAQAVEPGQSEKEQSNLKAESSPNAGDAREASGIAGTTRSYSLEDKGKSSVDRNANFVQNNVNLPGFGLGDPAHAVASGSGAEKGVKLEVIVADRSASPETSGNTELQLAQKGVAVMELLMEASGKEKLESNDGSKLLKSPGNSELPLLPNEPMISTLKGQNSRRSCGKQELIDPCSWNLALAKVEIDVKDNRIVSELGIGGTLPPANRSYWDLNTMMDTWEGSMKDVATSHKLRDAGESNGAATHDTKPVISSGVMDLWGPVSTGVTTGKDILDNNEYKSKRFSNPHDQQSVSDNLLLCLSPSGLQSSSSQEYSCVRGKVDSRGLETDLRLSETPMSSASKLNMIGCTVKSEPLNEANKQDFRLANASFVKFLDIGNVKSEPLENYSQESLRSLELSNMKFLDHGFVKSELAKRNNQDILKLVEEVQSQIEQETCTAGVPIIKDGLHCSEISTSSMKTYSTGELSRPLESHTSAVGLPRTAEFSSQSDLSEALENYSQESLRSLELSNMKFLDHGFVKSELAKRNNQDIPKPVEEVQSQIEQETCTAGVPIIKDGLHCSEISTSSMKTYSTGELSCPLESHTSAVGLPRTAEFSSQSDLPSRTKETPLKVDVTAEACGSFSGFKLCVASDSVDAKESNTGDGVRATSETKALGAIDGESSGLELTCEIRPDSSLQSEVDESDEEKINISADMMEDDAFDTDCESDSHAMGVTSVEDKHGVEEDYEDGEVREQLLPKGGASGERETEHVDGNSENRGASICDDHASISNVEGRVAKIEENGGSKNAFCGGLCNSSLLNEKNNQDMGKVENDQDTDKVATSKEALGVEMLSTGSDKKVTIRAARKSLKHSGREDGSMCHEGDLTSKHSFIGVQGTTTVDGESDAVSQQEPVKGGDSCEINHLVMSKVELSTDGDETTKDANGRGSRSRIINLAQASNGSCSSRPRSIPGRSLPSRPEKEIYTDVILKGVKIHSRGNRDEGYSIGTHKFERERNQAQGGVNCGSDFWHGRRRVDNRLDTLRGDWDSVYDFGSEHYNRPTGLQLPRSTNKVAAAAAKLEGSGFVVAPDLTVVGSGRGGRKPMDDELSGFCHPLSRRRSPVAREGPGTHVVRRPPRDVSPDRCAGGLRHEEKFMRGMPDDILGPVFSHSQPQFERVDPFLIGGRSFSPVRRRVPPRVARIRSKSPPRSQSPGPWSSPRRSPNGFDGHSALTRRRSPPVYRMRSPNQHPCFADDMVGRRHVSPPYISRLPSEIREMGSSREHEHPRPFISNRRLSGRVFPRNNRRFDMIDPQERTENDDYFGGPMHSNRLHELGGEGVDERRKGNERRGPIRSFRPPYNGTHVENCRFNFEDSPRPYQFCPEPDAEFHERGSFREREFDRRLKSRPDNLHRSTRFIEEQEENFRNGGQGWNDTNFNDVTQVKRRRF